MPDRETTAAGSIRRLTTAELTDDQTRTLRSLFAAAWPETDDQFADDDWEHARGGIHVLREVGSSILSHASVVPRTLEIAGAPLRTGYVEAVATWPYLQGHGHGTAVMREIGAIIGANYELGALGTGAFAFYERLGWERWRGPSFVRESNGVVRTPDDDGYIMVLRTPSTPAELDLTGPVRCDWRGGDVW